MLEIFLEHNSAHLFVFQSLVDECKATLENIYGVTSVHGRFYELSSNYHKLMGNHAEYYKEALRYLGCTKLEDIAGRKTSIIKPLLYLALGNQLENLHTSVSFGLVL